MDYTIVNGSNQKLIFEFYSIPYIPNPKKPVKKYEILPLDICKIGINPNEDTFFIVLGKASTIEFEVLASNKKIHVTKVDNFSYKLDSKGRKIQLDIKRQ